MKHFSYNVVFNEHMEKLYEYEASCRIVSTQSLILAKSM